MEKEGKKKMEIRANKGGGREYSKYHDEINKNIKEASRTKRILSCLIITVYVICALVCLSYHYKSIRMIFKPSTDLIIRIYFSCLVVRDLIVAVFGFEILVLFMKYFKVW